MIDLRSDPLTSGIERRWIRYHGGTSLRIWAHMWPPVIPPHSILRYWLGQNGGDEIIKALWILLGVDRWDLCPCLEKGETKMCHLVLALFMTYWNRVCYSYPMFDCLSCMGCFLLGIIWSENVNHRHEVDFFFRSICKVEWTTVFKQELEWSETELSLAFWLSTLNI